MYTSISIFSLNTWFKSPEWKQETFADGDKNIDMSFVAGTTTGTAPYTTQLCEGTCYLYAKAIDKSGNEFDLLQKI